MKKQSKKGKILVSRRQLGRVMLVLCILIFILGVGNIVQFVKAGKLKKTAEMMTEQSVLVQADKDALEKTLKEKEQEIESLNESLAISEELKENIDLVKNLRFNNEKLQKKIDELQSQLGIPSEATTETVTISPNRTEKVQTSESTATATTSTASGNAGNSSNSTGTEGANAASSSEMEMNSLVGDKLTKYFHKPECDYVGLIENENKVMGTKEKLMAENYQPCTYCTP